MLYRIFVELYEKLASTTKKLEKRDIIAGFLPHLKGHEEWIYLLRGRVFADYDEREFGISTQLVIKAIAKASGVSAEKVNDKYKKIGDLGNIAEELVDKGRQKTLFSGNLDADKVFFNLRRLVEIEGKGAVDKKLNLIIKL